MQRQLRLQRSFSTSRSGSNTTSTSTLKFEFIIVNFTSFKFVHNVKFNFNVNFNGNSDKFNGNFNGGRQLRSSSLASMPRVNLTLSPLTLARSLVPPVVGEQRRCKNLPCQKRGPPQGGGHMEGRGAGREEEQRTNQLIEQTSKQTKNTHEQANN